MTRVAAVGDTHFGVASAGTLRPHLETLEAEADVLLLAGDLTTCGLPREAGVLAAELAPLRIPVVAVLGNHDYRSGLEREVGGILADAGVIKGRLLGERPELYPFLGSHLLGEAADQGGADLVLHGHAHRGTEEGVTPAGIHVRNVAQPVLRTAFALFSFGSRQSAPDPAVEVPAGRDRE